MSNETSKSTVKRLIWDCETSPNVVFSWRVGYNLNLDHNNIIKERKIICIGYKWQGEPTVTVLRWDKNQDDKAMLKQFLEVANQADELVAHYGNHFDMPWFRTRCIIHGFDPIPIYKTVDTKDLASKYFLFNSNKLDYVSKVLGFGGKIKTDFDLWIRVVLGKEEAALNDMCEYCGVDVVRLEQVYDRISGFVRTKSHAGVMAGGQKWQCAHCGSDLVYRDKRRVTALGTIQHQMRCRKCHAYYTISDRSYNEFLGR